MQAGKRQSGHAGSAVGTARTRAVPRQPARMVLRFADLDRSSTCSLPSVGLHRPASRESRLAVPAAVELSDTALEPRRAHGQRRRGASAQRWRGAHSVAMAAAGAVGRFCSELTLRSELPPTSRCRARSLALHGWRARLHGEAPSHSAARDGRTAGIRDGGCHCRCCSTVFQCRQKMCLSSTAHAKYL